MKISKLFVSFALLLLLLACVQTSRKAKMRLNDRETPNVIMNITKVIKKAEPVNITDPEGTVLYQYALGIADIIVSDPGAAKECQPQPWKIDQPTIQNGTSQWFRELQKPLSKLSGLLDVYALQSVCNTNKGNLKGWIGGAMPKEKARYDEAIKTNRTYTNIDYPDPYGNQSLTTNSTDTKKRRVFLSKAKKAKAKSGSKKSKTKDWWGVLSLSLPLCPYHIYKSQLALQKMQAGFIFYQTNQYIDCVAQSPNTPKGINDKIVAFRSLMNYVKNGDETAFGNVFGELMCNWNRFTDFIKSLEASNKEKDEKKKWLGYGQSIGKLIVAVSTVTDVVTEFNTGKNKKKK